jgi:tetratricopeptide (TPR) repeat protein
VLAPGTQTSVTGSPAATPEARPGTPGPHTGSDATRLAGASPGYTTPGISDAPTGETGALDDAATRMATGPVATDSGSGPLQPGQSFGDRYHIVRLLGLGGMGAVYQAWDEELGVLVALKVIRPEAAADPEAAQALQRRFKQELLLARQVTHKNVVRIHDLGEMHGIKYITMPYIEGHDLATVLNERGALPVPEVMRIARSMISGLAAAHAAGVVHRDLKPANIMLTAEGEALIMDFGIARSTGAPVGAVGGRLQAGNIVAGQTTLGAIVGTIQYMAPEQARAQQIDHRADIYAAGLIIYDMLGGRRRLTRAESAIAELTGRTLEAPPRLRTINPSIPEPLEQIVDRCLQPAVEKRYATTPDLIADLDRLDDEGELKPVERRLTPRVAGAAAAVVALLLATTWWFASTPGAPVERPPLSVLIADFQNGTGDSVFTGAIEQALSIAMEDASFVSAYPRARAKQAAERLRAGAALDEDTARLVARREALNVVLAGTIALSGGTYSLEARALDVARPDDDDGVVIARASTTAGSKADVLPAVANLAAQLRRRLGDTAASVSAPSETFTAASLDAMRAYVKGQDLQVAGQFEEALEAYQEAVRYDEGFGRAYAGMGVIYGNLKQDQKAEESYQQALKHLNRMTEREKYATLGSYYLLVARDYARAIDNYKQLVERFPADRGGHANLAYAYLNVRNMDGAVEQVREALSLEPGNMLQRMNYGMYSLYASDFDTAIEQSRMIPPESGLFPYAVFTEARAIAAAGDLVKAREVVAELAKAKDPGPALGSLATVDLALVEGRYGAVIDTLNTEAAAEQKSGNPGEAAARLVVLAEAQRALGRRADAVAAATRALALSRQDSIALPAGLLFVEAGERQKAEAVAAELENRLQAQSRSYASLIRGALEARAKRFPAAIDALRAGQQRHDSWFAHQLLGMTYFEAGDIPSALAEFDTCLKRRGEVSDVFFADSATLRYLPPIYYWLARAQESLGNPDARANYERYVSLRYRTDSDDPLLSDAQRRIRAARP